MLFAVGLQHIGVTGSKCCLNVRVAPQARVRLVDQPGYKPWPTLTLVVSLEAIFLSTFVMIGQNRQAAFQQAKADHDYNSQELELKTNTQLTREIHVLTAELYRRYVENPRPQQS
jgi:uncharacterized membrane protein